MRLRKCCEGGGVTGGGIEAVYRFIYSFSFKLFFILLSTALRYSFVVT